MNPAAARSADPAPPPDRGLSRPQRLVRRTHFQECFLQGRKWVGRLMVLWLREGEDASLRLGVISSRKVGGAVRRNRARRRLREAYRCNRFRFEGRYDVVLVARRPVADAGASETEAELLRLARRAGLLSGESTTDGHG